ncbi:hypothetical protein Gotri_024936 [Gossypium trilobum]|uniref:Uncharacterized protein n=1 Tax=Gossypium trilobum TaxID=34281 RepID=A0A7J9FQ56_9ROSI|nr:hypothetical protein [Gossypium trilobum]
MDSVPLWLSSGLSVPSQELSQVSYAKARALWLLEWKAPREAGFTEQRKLPPLGSRRITGCCHLDPIWSSKQWKSDMIIFVSRKATMIKNGFGWVVYLPIVSVKIVVAEDLDSTRPPLLTTNFGGALANPTMIGVYACRSTIRSAYNFEGDARSLIKQLEQGESEYIDLILDDRRRLGDNIKTCFRHCLARASLDIENVSFRMEEEPSIFVFVVETDRSIISL